MSPRSLSAAAIAAAFLLSGCGGPGGKMIRRVDALISQGDYAAASSYIKDRRESSYGRKNSVLYDMDLGAVEHYAGHYNQSEQSLAAADHRMTELFTKSLHKEAETLFLNDKTVDYVGRPYERVFTHVFRAIGYAIQGRKDDAVVEANNAEFFLDNLSQFRQGAKTYKDDAFVRYLDALLYADTDDLNDARVSYRRSQDAFKWYASAYNVSMPEFELGRKDGGPSSELVLIHYNGPAPWKVSKGFSVSWGQGMVFLQSAQSEGDPQANSSQVRNALAAGLMGHNITISYPVFVQEPFQIVSSEVLVDSQTAVPTRLVEDVSAIAFKDLSDIIDFIKAKSVVRAMVKYIVSQAATRAVEKQFGQGWAALTEIGTAVISEATETADTRSWTTLPSQVRMARLKVLPGKHSVEVVFKDAAGVVVRRASFPNVSFPAHGRTYLQTRT